MSRNSMKKRRYWKNHLKLEIFNVKLVMDYLHLTLHYKGTFPLCMKKFPSYNVICVTKHLDAKANLHLIYPSFIKMKNLINVPHVINHTQEIVALMLISNPYTLVKEFHVRHVKKHLQESQI